MAKRNDGGDMERLRDEEREVETEAAYTGGEKDDRDEGGFAAFKFPECEPVDDLSVARRVVEKASSDENSEDHGDPGVGGGGTSGEKDF